MVLTRLAGWVRFAANPADPVQMMSRTLAISIFLLAGCAAPIEWREVEHDQSFEHMWGRFTLIAANSGFPIDGVESDRGMKKFVSKWRGQAAAFGKSQRRRLHAEFERRESEPGWRIRFHIQNQVVTDMAPGFGAVDADWSDRGQDATQEQILLGQLRLAFGQDLGIDPTFGQR